MTALFYSMYYFCSQVGEVVAYAIGEFVSLDESGRQAYEIVTAFVQPQ